MEWCILSSNIAATKEEKEYKPMNGDYLPVLGMSKSEGQ